MSMRILIIEDNVTNMELMAYLLESYGYVVDTAFSGKEGMEQALRQSPDLIVCDLEMPGMSGYEVATEVRSSNNLQDVPLIAVTAYAMVGDRDRVLSRGFDGYIAKPIFPENFVQQVEGFLPPQKRIGRAPAEPQAAEMPTCAELAKRASILVVDDSPTNLQLIHSTLAPSGYDVIPATNVSDALEQAASRGCDLILSDLHMPIDSGLDFLRRVRADPRLKSIPFILFTSSSTEQLQTLRKTALNVGASEFVSRPVEPRLLLSLVDHILKTPLGEPYAARTCS